ncbi:MAG TPA: hypothetical protein VFZ01_11620 [Geminicoccaceae bacterium]
MTEDHALQNDEAMPDVIAAADPGAVSGAQPAPAAGPAPAADPAAEAEAAALPPTRPEGVPEKFWDAEAGLVRTEALLKSYRELERKLGRMVPLPSDEADDAGHERLRRALGVPESAEGYQIEAQSELIQPDPDINARLHAAGFSQSQAQMVYDLAAEYVVPLVDQAVAEVAATRDVERLAGHFGGGEAWRAVARQIETWGRANLPADTMEVLASNYEGVLAMHHMMRASEPSVVQGADGGPGESSETELRQLMRDPRYWRDRDPALIARVTDGFARLYSK